VDPPPGPFFFDLRPGEFRAVVYKKWGHRGETAAPISAASAGIGGRGADGLNLSTRCLQQCSVAIAQARAAALMRLPVLGKKQTRTTCNLHLRSDRAHLGCFFYEECRPNSAGAVVLRSCQFGLTSAPIAPHTVQTMRGPNDGTVTSSLISSLARLW
jgi:hypothetical protein